jgi:hypothetical protein
LCILQRVLDCRLNELFGDGSLFFVTRGIDYQVSRRQSAILFGQRLRSFIISSRSRFESAGDRAGQHYALVAARNPGAEILGKNIPAIGWEIPS